MTATTAAAAPPTDRSAPRMTHGEIVPRRAALIAGVGYAALFVLAIFANFVVVEGMVVADDAAATVANVSAQPGLFRLGVATFLVIAAIDVVVAWALHALLRDVAPDRSLLAGWLRVLHSIFLAVAVVFLGQAGSLASAAGQAGSGGVDGVQVMAALDLFDRLWMVGLAFFGLHLVVVATLLTGSRSAPRALRIVLMFAGCAYMVDTMATLIVADYEAIASVMLTLVAVPSVVGEGWFGLWLLIRGGRPSTVRA